MGTARRLTARKWQCCVVATVVLCVLVSVFFDLMQQSGVEPSSGRHVVRSKSTFSVSQLDGDWTRRIGIPPSCAWHQPQSESRGACAMLNRSIVASVFVVGRHALEEVLSRIPPLASAAQQNRFEGRCAKLVCRHEPNRVPVDFDLLKDHVVLPRGETFFLTMLLNETPAHQRDPLEGSSGIHVLLMSSPKYVRTRLLPALDTWLRHERVTVFFDTYGDGREPHQQQSEVVPPTSWQQELMTTHANHVDAFMISSRRRVSRARFGINGAWKPLAIFALLPKLFRREASVLSSSWILLADDDTFVMMQNLAFYYLSTHLPVPSGEMFGAKHNFRKLMRSSTQTEGGAVSFVSLDYLQGGAGILFSSVALDRLLECMEARGITQTPTTHPSISQYDLTLASHDAYHASHVNATDFFADSTTVTAFLIKSFADEWPAGDMRLAWLVEQCRPDRRFHVSLVHDARFSHRSVELAFGMDRRHWSVGGSPISFHRLRDEAAFSRLNGATVAAKDAPEAVRGVVTWSILQSKLQEAYLDGHTSKANSTSLGTSIRDHFFDDDGFA